MTAKDYQRLFQELARRLLGVVLLEEHGVSASELKEAEARLGRPLPPALWAFYSVAGRFHEFCDAHNRVIAPDKLTLVDSHLLFMEENQEVVSWGIPVSALDAADPIVWQRVNTEPETWYSEEKSFSRLMVDMYQWYDEIGLWGTGSTAR